MDPLNKEILNKINFKSLKYLIKNSEEMYNYFEDYNSSKNRIYNLIGNELGNLEIEFPILFPIGI
ncbi:hypothetical protein Mgra_00004720 [Meloidogyne graminicola]|uniref:Uncharacterized protein n=1 Tax=Meloidogyne graminicola TaxID=189291 RepID=A0A8S9ZQB4_9BILA|nr:hypothetical protein Mgra_00004720 [Meloidogyne graminicola]